MTQGKCKVLNRDMMKYLAIFFMFWGHLFGWYHLMRNVGYDQTLLPAWQQIAIHLSLFCPPVMFFFIADGYKYTRDRKKYALRLLLFALITQPFDWLIFQPLNGWWTGNVIFDLFFGLLVLMAWESGYKTWQRVLMIAGLLTLDGLCMSPWMIGGPLFVLFLHVFREKPRTRLIAYTALTLLYKGLEAVSLNPDATYPALGYLGVLIEFLAAMAAYFCMTTFYNGKKGRHPTFAKWFFYAFYPLHYLVIWAAYKII